jgi:tRNA pseudouridine55 synthase
VLEPAPNGIILVDKPRGISSHRSVAIARRRLGTRKIGHAGTLDPMATGLLVLGVGPSTRLLTHVVGVDKRYRATMRLGVVTDTDDADGEATAMSGASLQAVIGSGFDRAVAARRGHIDQVPSTVSAIKVDGRRAYARVRAGEDVELAARSVTVTRLDVLDSRRSTITVGDRRVEVVDVELDVECSSGTYVRALARDIGADLGVGGHLVALRRTRVGPFDVDAAIALEDEAVDVRSALGRPADVARRLFPAVTLDDAAAKDLGDGKRVPTDHEDTAGPLAAVTAGDDRLVGLATVRSGMLRVITNFPTGADR